MWLGKKASDARYSWWDKSFLEKPMESTQSVVEITGTYDGWSGRQHLNELRVKLHALITGHHEGNTYATCD